MENTIAIIGIAVKGGCRTDGLNAILHEYAEYINGRMGLPNLEDGLNVISVVAVAPMDVINAMSGKLGRLNGISAKTMCLAKPKYCAKESEQCPR